MAAIIAGTYEVIEKIGSGGGGIVYLANHMRLGKKVVLKADKRKITTKPEILRREVDTLKDLNHTYIPQVYDFFVEDETVYTVIDYVEGESMDKPLKRGDKFTQPQVIKWACELLEALCYLHNPIHGIPPRGIVHSDIKPANIMFKPDGDICLIDFNIALALGEENVVGLSAGYASPEHYGLDFSTDSSITENSFDKFNSKNAGDLTSTMTNAEETGTMEMSTATLHNGNLGYSSSPKKIVIPDARSDIYSLGATLYHLLSGTRPSKNAKEVIPLSDKYFSPLIVKIIAKSMNPNPDLRYQTAEEMLYDFTHLRENDYRTKKRRKLCMAVSTILAITFLGGAFTSFVGLKRMETTQKCLTLAEYSRNALEAGDPETAVKYALDALPDPKSIFTPPYTVQAQKALADSLGVYDLSDGYKPHHIVELPSETFKTVLSPNGKTGIAVYSFAIAVFDTETGEITTTLPTVKSALSDVVYINNDLIVYAGEEGITVYNIKTNNEIWRGKPATHISVSADGKVIAGIYKDEGFATIYDINGNEKSTVSFNGNKQRVVQNDTFADPKDNLMALNNTGQYLAVSFENGDLIIYDTVDLENYIEVYDKSDYTHFEGGFKGQYFAFSASKNGLSEFAVIDLAEFVQTIGFETDSLIGVIANENNIYLCNKNTVVAINPVTGEQTEAAYTDADIRMFANDAGNTIAATEKNEYLFYDKDADLITRYSAGQADCNFVDISGEYAIVAGIDTPSIKILKKKQYESADICTYDAEYYHDEARISEDGTKILLFDYKSFRICDTKGNIIKEVSIPDAELVYDQQYIKESGNLAVMYDDVFRLYSGMTGDLIYEATNLKSVLYAPYGVSIFDGDEIKLIDLNSGDVLESGKGNGDFGAYCGMYVDSSFLDGGKVIGAGKTKSGYYFASAKENMCTVYNDKGEKKFEIPISDQTETFFTDTEVILSPLHGTPEVYNLKTGEKIADLEKDAYLTYITEVDKYIVSEYISASGERYAILLDKNTFEALAYLPSLTDIYNRELIFDFHKGKLRKTHIYHIDDLINLANGGDID